MNVVAAVAAAFLALAPLGSAAQPVVPLDALAAGYIADVQRLEPIFADQLGVTTYGDALPDRTRAGHDREMASLRDWRARIAAGTSASDAVGVRADRQALLDAIDQTLIADELLAPWRRDPNSYVSDIGGAVFFPLIRAGEPADARFGHISARLAALPGLIDAAIANLDRTTEPAAKLASTQLGGTIELYENTLPKAASAEASPAVAARLSAALPRAVAALKRFKAFVDGPLLAHADLDPRIGRVAYERLFRVTVGTDTTPQELDANARARIAAGREQMLALAEPLFAKMFPTRVVESTTRDGVRVIKLQAVLDELAKHHTTADSFLPAARAAVAENEAFLQRTRAIDLPVPDTLQVRRTPPFESGVTVASAETAGPYAPPNAPSYYNVDVLPADPARAESLLREYNDYELRLLTIHEAIPGHYVQLRYANRNPSLVRRALGNGSFIEGWAVWTEGFMLDQGFGGGDPALRLFQLKWRLREATNAVLDFEYHAGSLTKEQAMNLMVHDAFQERSEAEGKWNRLQLSYVQLATYYAGLEAIERAQAGSGLDPRAFARRLLAMGSVEPRFITPLLGRP